MYASQYKWGNKQVARCVYFRVPFQTVLLGMSGVLKVRKYCIAACKFTFINPLVLNDRFTGHFAI